jgi:hypothetical protein
VKLHLDIETYSEADLKKEGLYRYANDYSTELLADDAQEPLLLKALNGQLYIKRLEPLEGDQ